MSAGGERFDPARIGVWGVVLACLMLAIAFCLRVFWRDEPDGVVSYDIYAAHYPILWYAKQSLAEGHGLLWNRLQNCGQPFLPTTLAGLLYPPNWLLLWLDLDHGFLLIAILHMTLTALGMYALCREMSLSRVASASAALGWEISAHVVSMAGWQPTSILGVYVWIPFAMCFVERSLRRPSASNGLGLGLLLTLQTLAGYPQIQVFTYLLIGLRLLWQLLSRPRSISLGTLGAFALGLGLPVFLGAATLLPMAEFAQLSLRNASLSVTEMDPTGSLTWQAFRNEQVGPRAVLWGTTLALVPLALGGLGIAASSQRRLALFYLFASAIFVALAFENPLSSAYQALPINAAFRYPSRILWMVGFTLSVLAAFGVEALQRGGEAVERRLHVALLGCACGSAVLLFVSPVGLQRWEWAALAGLAAACLLAFRFRRVVPAAAIALLLLLANLWSMNGQQFFYYLRDGFWLFRHQDAFDVVRGRITLQERIHQYGVHPDYAMMPKSASLFGVPSVDDYEPQASLRYAELYVRMLDAEEMTSINQYYFRFNNLPRTLPLLNLLAVRYLLTADRSHFRDPLYADFKLVWKGSGLRVFENPDALPRAFYVPRALVMEDPRATLNLLSSSGFDPRKLLLLAEPPADEFLGSDAGTGSVEILSDRSERVELAVQASAEGFLFISDQDYPGWEALRDGETLPILRANHAFRAVRVPAGESRIVFRYRPQSVRIGFAVSLATALGVAIFFGAQHFSARRQPVQGRT